MSHFCENPAASRPWVSLGPVDVPETWPTELPLGPKAGNSDGGRITNLKRQYDFPSPIEACESRRACSEMYVTDCGDQGVFVFQREWWNEEKSEAIPSAAIVIEKSGDRFQAQVEVYW